VNVGHTVADAGSGHNNRFSYILAREVRTRAVES